jgi:hypothetical protein
MQIANIPIQVEHPPHKKGIKMIVFLLGRFLTKTLLFLSIFSLSFYFSESFNDSPYSQLQRRQEAIGEITAVLERQGTDLKDIKMEDLATVIYEEATRYNHDPKSSCLDWHREFLQELIGFRARGQRANAAHALCCRGDGTRAWD